MLSKRFPYAICYDDSNDTNYVIAVLPMRRNPDWINDRLNR